MNPFIKRFAYALSGLKHAFFEEKNIQLHLLFFLAVCIAGLVFEISASEWLSVLLCSTLVLCLEMANTALEKLCDVLHPNKHPQIKIIKDLSAGMVLLSALFSLAVAGIVFIPKILAFFQ